MYGKEFSNHEALFHEYYAACDEREAAMKGKLIDPMFSTKGIEHLGIPQQKFEQIGERIDKSREAIFAAFMEAVDKHDGEAIMSIARAVWFFKDKRYPNPPIDRERTKLLFLKTALEREPRQRAPTIREIAHFLAWEDEQSGKKFDPDPSDGFSALRRKCKELGIPITQSRKWKRKKHP